MVFSYIQKVRKIPNNVTPRNLEEESGSKCCVPYFNWICDFYWPTSKWDQGQDIPTPPKVWIVMIIATLTTTYWTYAICACFMRAFHQAIEDKKFNADTKNQEGIILKGFQITYMDFSKSFVFAHFFHKSRKKKKTYYIIDPKFCLCGNSDK